MFHASDDLPPTLKSVVAHAELGTVADRWRYLSFSRSELNSSFAS
jgi:hypothetical protein